MTQGIKNGWRVLSMLALAALIGLTGCADSFTGHDELESPRSARYDGPKFRHQHLFDQALTRRSAGKSQSSDDLHLIVKLADHVVDKQKVLERYRVMDRYKVLDRYRVLDRFDYNSVFNGWAWQIEDSLGTTDFDPFLAELTQDPDILWFEPDFDVDSPPSNASPGAQGQQIPWSVAAIGGTQSWAVSGDGTGSVDIDLYVLDTGIANADNDDPNDDLALVENLDFREDMNDAVDHDGHGTHVAGIAAAVDDNDGLVGVAPGARIHNLKVLGDNGRSDVSIVIAAVEHITAQKQANPSVPIVVNMSLGEDIGTPDYSALDEAIQASAAAGVVYVVAAGNAGKDAATVTPAKVTEAITVGSYDLTNRFSSFSNWGPKVDILAPGEDIVSLSPSGAGAPVEMSGTSMAAAHVSGAAALYLAQHPSATPAQVRQALLDAAKANVTDVPSGTTNKSVWVGEAGTESIEVRVSSGNDDAEEEVSDGDMDLSSSDLELISEGSNAQRVGIRFAATNIPQGVTITRAYVQFQVDETDNGTTALTIHGQNADHAASFTSSAFNISSRALTTASVAWAPPAWNSVGAAGLDQRTPDLTAVIQEIVSRPGWQSGNALALVITGTGERTAESYNGDASAAPLLHVEWTP